MSTTNADRNRTAEAAARYELACRAGRIKAEILQYRRDVDSWNCNRPEHPIDPDPDGELARGEEFVDGLLAELRGRGVTS